MNKNIEDTEYVEYIEYIEYIEYNESATVPQARSGVSCGEMISDLRFFDLVDLVSGILRFFDSFILFKGPLDPSPHSPRSLHHHVPRLAWIFAERFWLERCGKHKVCKKYSRSPQEELLKQTSRKLRFLIIIIFRLALHRFCIDFNTIFKCI